MTNQQARNKPSTDPRLKALGAEIAAMLNADFAAIERGERSVPNKVRLAAQVALEGAELTDPWGPVYGYKRTARKEWRCKGADPMRSWSAALYSERGSVTYNGHRSEGEAIAYCESKMGKPAAYNADKGMVPSDWYESYEVTPQPNEYHHPDCLVTIGRGERYFEFMENAPPYHGGDRFCAVCAVAKWGTTEPETVVPEAPKPKPKPKRAKRKADPSTSAIADLLRF